MKTRPFDHSEKLREGSGTRIEYTPRALSRPPNTSQPAHRSALPCRADTTRKMRKDLLISVAQIAQHASDFRGGIMSTEKHYFIEEKYEGKYAVRARGAWRANKVVDSQIAAKQLVKSLNPNDNPEISRIQKDESCDCAENPATEKEELTS